MRLANNTIRISGVIGALFAAAALVAADSNAPDTDGLRFVDSPKPLILNCSPYLVTPCFRVEVVLPGGRQIPLPASGNLRDAVHVRFDDQSIEPFYVEAAGTRAVSARYTLILIDISGSMNSLLPSRQTRFEAAKSAAKAYLQNFDPGVDRIAVVPFESHQVISRIRAAKFVRKRSEVESQIDSLPTPRGNTGLYAAVSAGVDTLVEQKNNTPGADVELILLTDGKNDVEADDDQELASLEYTFSPVVLKLENSNVPVYAVGLGPLDENAEADLKTLSAQHDYFATDAQDLRDVFSRVRGLQTDRLRISFNCPLDKSRLGGKNHTIEVRLDNPELTAQTEWIPPDMLPPGFDGRIDSDEDKALQESSVEPPPPFLAAARQPILVFLVWSAALLIFWFVFPRFIWPERYLERYAPVDEPVSTGGSAAARTDGPPMGATQLVRSGSDETIVTDRKSGATRTPLK